MKSGVYDKLNSQVTHPLLYKTMQISGRDLCLCQMSANKKPQKHFGYGKCSEMTTFHPHAPVQSVTQMLALCTECKLPFKDHNRK